MNLTKGIIIETVWQLIYRKC